MKRLFILLTASTLAFTACRKIEVDGSPSSNSTSVSLSGKISSNMVLKGNTTYLLRGIVYVVDGATLTIEPGAIIQGEKSSRGALVVTRGSKLIADGTKDKPVVFTSDAATPSAGDWGGIVLLGRARTNSSYNGQTGIGEVEGGVNNGEGLGLYGGTDDADNSGILRYVRIEYAGYAFLPDKELNALTMGAVGSGTIIDYVQVAHSLDDAFEWFGGTVNCKHLISYKTLDDDFDTDNGYRGNVQFGIVLRDSTKADISKVEAFESDNDANGSTVTPQTAAVFSNMTVCGPRATTSNTGSNLFLAGAQIRRNSSISIFNSVIMGWPTGLFIDASKGTPTDNNITASNATLFVQNTVIAGCTTPVKYAASATSPTGTTDASLLAWFSTSAYGNTIYPANTDLMLGNPFNYAAPDFTPQPGSPLLTGSSFGNAKLTGFSPVAFRGAVAASGPEADWWKGWTMFK